MEFPYIQNISFKGISLKDYVAEKLNVNEDFLFNLQKEDDWGFVIKTSALLETLVTDLIINAVPDSRMHTHIEKLNLSGVTGKIKLGKELNILSKDLCNFCEAFSPIRNQFVHGTKNLHTTFNQFISDADGNIVTRLKNCIDTTPRSQYGGGAEPSFLEVFDVDPRYAVFNTLCIILMKSLLTAERGLNPNN